MSLFLKQPNKLLLLNKDPRNFFMPQIYVKNAQYPIRLYTLFYLGHVTRYAIFKLKQPRDELLFRSSYHPGNPTWRRYLVSTDNHIMIIYRLKKGTLRVHFPDSAIKVVLTIAFTKNELMQTLILHFPKKRYEIVSFI